MADNQAGMFDVEIDDPILERALVDRSDPKLAEAAKKYAKAARTIKAQLEGREFKAGDRVRVGSRHFEIKVFKGGGFAIDEWTAQGVQKIAAVEE